MALVVGANSWLSVADADAYFVERLGAAETWNDALVAATKEAALITAYRQLMADDRFAFPVTIMAAMKNGQCEYALFLLQNVGDTDARMGIRAQGVISAGVAKEGYAGYDGELPYPPTVMALLKPYWVGRPVIGGVLIYRNENDERLGE